MQRYHLEVILNIQNHTSCDTLKNSIIEFGDNLEIIPVASQDDIKGTDYSIRIETFDPTVIFDTCSQFGRLKSVKINEARRS